MYVYTSTLRKYYFSLFILRACTHKYSVRLYLSSNALHIILFLYYSRYFEFTSYSLILIEINLMFQHLSGDT